MNLLKNKTNRYGLLVLLCGSLALLCLSLPASADELQDAEKLFKQGHREQALEQVNSYLKSKPKDAQGRFLKGLILTDEGKTNDAIRDFSELTEDYPELPEPYNNLAVLYASQGQYDKARIALEMAIRTHPSYATAHENLGDIYAKMASQAYDRALQLDRNNASTQTKLELIKELFSSERAADSKPATKTAIAAVTLPAAVATEQKIDKVPPASPAAKTHTGSPAAEPASEVASSHGNKDDVVKAVHAWADAWSSKNVKKYLSLYAGAFAVPDGQSRENWESMRTERLTKPKFIHVGIDELSVNFDDDAHATVSFRQSYKASHFRAHDKKTLKMLKSGDDWLIQEENTGK